MEIITGKQSELDWQNRYWRPSFRDHLTQTEIVDRLLSYNEKLKQSYEVYQSFLSVLQYHEQEEKQQEAIEGFQSLLMQS